jgi:ATP-binding cassette subfamily F protein uup
MLLRFRDLSLNLGSTVLLERAELTIDRGERVCVIGRNGAGKSTLLRLLDGQMQADEGEFQREPGLKVARLAQDVPPGEPGSVFDVVARGLGEAGQVLAQYHALIASGSEDMTSLGRLQTRIEALDAWTLDQRVHETLSRVELPADAAFSSLSGGLKRRALLAQALVSDPDLLLLDEPTNHLDIESIAWLEAFLLSFAGAIVFVTHDRAFLQRLATRIVELDRGWLTSWPGDYANYLRRKEERRHAEAQANAQFDKVLAQEEAWIRQGIEARRTRNQGRVERLMQLRREFSQRRNEAGKAKIAITEAQSSGKLVVEARAVRFSRGERVIVRGLDTVILRGEKIGIIGPNGAGKTTLIQLLLGQLAPDEGELRVGSNLQIAYFDQLRAGLDENAPVFENLGEGKDFIEVGGQQRHVMSYLQDFLFTPDRARSPTRILSGGERSRLLLARLFAKPSNLLVLDEPTNDLDIETLELLEDKLTEYDGTVLMVSHDRAFLNNVVTRCLAFEGGGRIGDYVGGYDDWLRQRPQPSAGTAGNPPAKPAAAAAPSPGSRNAPAPPSKSLSAKEWRELEQLPARIDTLEKQQAELAGQLSAARGMAAAQSVQSELTKVADALAQAYARWEALEARR